MGLAAAAACIAVLAMVCFGAGFGRFQVTPVEGQGKGVGLSSSAAAVVEPVRAAELHEGDTIRARLENDRRESLYKITGIDSWTHEVYAFDKGGHLQKLKLGDQVGRVAHVIPYAGGPFGWLAGTPQGLALLLVAMLLFAKAALQRRMRYGDLPPLRRGTYARMRGRTLADDARSRLSRPWWWTRLGAAVMCGIGVLSLTAGATFTATASVNQGAISTGHMAIMIPGAGATNRLTLGASGLAPGDRIQRAVDVSIDASTTSGIMSGMTLAVTAIPSSLLDSNSTNGLKIFVQDCRTSGGASGWSESGSTPAFSYSCTKGAGGTWSDNLNSIPTNDPTGVPSAGTCATSNNGTGSYRAVSELGSAFPLVNLPTLAASTTLHLVITMCFPTNAGDTYQDLTSTLTFAFAGVQRSGTAK
jgi:spore coat-associated protein N